MVVEDITGHLTEGIDEQNLSTQIRDSLIATSSSVGLPNLNTWGLRTPPLRCTDAPQFGYLLSNHHGLFQTSGDYNRLAGPFGYETCTDVAHAGVYGCQYD
jgi:hypothetical protein